MNLIDFKGSKDEIIQKQCLKNSEIYLKLLNNFMEQKSVYLMEKQVVMKYRDQIPRYPLRGLLMLPKDINNLIYPKKNMLFENVNLHMCCMTRLDDDQKVYAHLLNTKGMNQIENITEADLIVILISSYLVYNSKVTYFDNVYLKHKIFPAYSTFG